MAKARHRPGSRLSRVRTGTLAATLEVPCFRYRGKALTARLTVEPGVGGGDVIHCPVRQHRYVQSPEERVRQALVLFLVEGAASAPAWRQRLRFEVEFCSLDVSAFHVSGAAELLFRPYIPVVIFETKRVEPESENDVATKEQLQRYMIRERCRSGFIFNARQAAWMTLTREFTAPVWKMVSVSDLRFLCPSPSKNARRTQRVTQWYQPIRDALTY
jgi:hypothetical protein